MKKKTRTKKNLIIDLNHDYVSLFVILGREETDYYGYSKISKFNEYEFLKRYGFNYENALQKDYENIFIVSPIPSLEEINFYIPSVYNAIIDKINNVNRAYSVLEKIKDFKNIFIIDNHDRAVCPVSFLEKKNLQFSALYKREYRTNIKKYGFRSYNKNVFPFPYVVFGDIEPTWFFFGQDRKENQKKPGCFWAGSTIVFEAKEEKDSVCDRRIFLEKISNFLVVPSTPLSQQNFVRTIGKFKTFLHLNGTGHLCKRFFEGLSQKSLMLYQDMELVFPFESGDRFPAQCCFKTPDEFIDKFTQLKTNSELYKECFSKQEQILNKYYNRDFIKQYLLKGQKFNLLKKGDQQ